MQVLNEHIADLRFTPNPHLVIVQVASGFAAAAPPVLPLLLPLPPSAARGFSTSLMGSGSASFRGSGSAAATLLSTSASVSAGQAKNK